MFNLKTAKTVDPYEALLSDNRKGKSLDNPVSTHENLLEDVQTGSKSELTEAQLQSVRIAENGAPTLEGQLNKHTPPADYPKRDDSNEKAKMIPMAALNAVQEAEKVAAYEKQGGVTRDTVFWDKYVGTQLEGKETKQPNQVPQDQLQNNYDRLKNLTVEDVSKQENVRKMIMASMKDADAMLYYVYHKAALEGRELNQEDQQIVEGITSDKIKLASMLG